MKPKLSNALYAYELSYESVDDLPGRSESETEAAQILNNTKITTAKLNLDELETEYSGFTSVSSEIM